MARISIKDLVKTFGGYTAVDRIQQRIEPRVDRGETVRRQDALVGLTVVTQDVARLRAHVLKHKKLGALGVVQMQPGLDLAAGPLE